MIVLGVPSRIEQDQRPITRRLQQFGNAGRAVFEFPIVALPEFIPTVRVMPEPTPQLGARRQTLRSQTQRANRYFDPRTQAIH